MTDWQQQGFWEYEYNATGYTGWYRRVDGRQPDGTWPEYHAQMPPRQSTHCPAVIRQVLTMGAAVAFQPCVQCGQQGCEHLTLQPDPSIKFTRIIANPPKPSV